MSPLLSLAGVATFLLALGIYLVSARKFALGALSLPCVMCLTTLIYFYLMPVIFLSSGYTHWFGVGLDDMDGVFYAAALYLLGAGLAFWHGQDTLMRSPLQKPGLPERPVKPVMFWLLLGFALLGVVGRVTTGQLAFSSAGELSDAANGGVWNFLNLTYSVLIALALYTLVTDRFGWKSLLFAAIVLVLFTFEGFRFLIVILATGAFISFAVLKGVRIRTAYIVAGCIAGISLLNAFGIARSYGRGLDLSQIEGLSWGELFESFGGEVGPVFVLQHLTLAPPPHIYFEPWVNTLARFIPAFLWPDKPLPQYLLLYIAGFPSRDAQAAGIAGTQHAEFLLQFGWWGLPVLAFLFFRIAVYILSRIQRLGFDQRLTGYAIIPGLFGFYAQQRGYTFQIVVEVIFTLGPVFLLSLGSRATASVVRGSLAQSR